MSEPFVNETSVTLAPSILAANFAAFGADAQTCVESGARWLHVDIMDGHFVPNLSFGPQIVSALRKFLPPDVVLDVHLMVSRPDDWIGSFADAGADAITVHVEAAPHLQRTLSSIRAANCLAGVALNPATPPETLRYVLPDLDIALVMTVNPGFGGQKFLSEAAKKVADLACLRDDSGTNFRISVDGGVDKNTAPRLVNDGARILVAGSSVFGHVGGISGGLSTLRDALGIDEKGNPR